MIDEEQRPAVDGDQNNSVTLTLINKNNAKNPIKKNAF